MTRTYTRDLARELRSDLTEPAVTEDDFVRLASAGEPLRRAAATLDAVPANVAALLAAYEAAPTPRDSAARRRA